MYRERGRETEGEGESERETVLLGGVVWAEPDPTLTSGSLMNQPVPMHAHAECKFIHCTALSGWHTHTDTYEQHLPE